MEPIIIYHLEQLQEEIAKTTSKSLSIKTPPGAAHFLGLNYIDALKNAVKQTYKHTHIEWHIDCIDDPAMVQSALSHGYKYILFSGNISVFQKLKEIAQPYNAHISTYNLCD